MRFRLLLLLLLALPFAGSAGEAQRVVLSGRGKGDAVPLQSIERVAIDARTNGAFTLDVFLKGVDDLGSGLAVEAEIISPDGAPAAPVFAQQTSGNRVTLRTRVESPLQMTVGTTNLYRVEIRLKRGVKVLHRLSQGFEFRATGARDGSQAGEAGLSRDIH